MSDHQLSPADLGEPTVGLVHTDIVGLDILLGGGIPEGDLMLIAGAPGTGKTIVTQQICFNVVAGGAERAIYFSTFSEPHDKMIRQLRSFHFYDASKLGGAMLLLSLQEFMRQGLDATAEVITRTARQQRARLVCIDGFRAIEAICPGEIEARQFLYQLSAQLHLLGTTLLITLERAASESDDYGTYTVADSVMVCHHDLAGMQRLRKVEIRKSRAMAHRQGMHSYRISQAGWTVFPRIETLVPAELAATPEARGRERLGFGIPLFDRSCGGGLTPGSTTLIAGGPGTGKTLLGLHYLCEGLRRGEPSLFLGFRERRDQLLEKAAHFGLPLHDETSEDGLYIRTFSPVDVEPDEISSAIRQEIAAHGIRRMVIDGTFELERATAREGRLHDYFGALVTYLRDAGVTICMTRLIGVRDFGDLSINDEPLMNLAENIILLHWPIGDEHNHGIATILKMRNSDFDRAPYAYSISPQGLTLASLYATSMT